MNALLQKKINILLHLARVDGHFDESEKNLIREILVTAGEKPDIDWSLDAGNLSDVQKVNEKEKLLYWAIQLIRVDGNFHPDEIAYCKTLSLKLKFKPELVDHFTQHELPEYTVFEKHVKNYTLN